MLLSKLLRGISHSEIKMDEEITDIVSSSREVKKGCLFVCIKGDSFDSHTIASQMLSQGASAVITQKNLGLEAQIVVPDTKKALARIWSNFYDNPEKKLKLIGVTGTNGKTSTTYMIRHILESVGYKTGLIGTVGYSFDKDNFTPSELTTPEPRELYRIFNTMANNGCEYCVMEVSSQALSQKRCDGLIFECGVFTNLTNDHLDYHKNMENYLAAKGELLKKSKISVVNCDDPNARTISAYAKEKKIFFSSKNKTADYYADRTILKENKCSYYLNGLQVNVPIPGKFTVYNSMGAVACCNLLGIPFENCIGALKNIPPVPGRAEVLRTDTPYKVLIDYAHTPDAVVNILATVKNSAKGRVVALFGCGGDRDKTKRPLMAKAAAENADYVIITTDNPRTENPNEIIEDILPGIRGINTPCAIIPDRTDAIEYALKNAKDNDIIVLCGKGHETYQIIGTDKLHYDEREIVKKYLEKTK